VETLSTPAYQPGKPCCGPRISFSTALSTPPPLPLYLSTSLPHSVLQCAPQRALHRTIHRYHCTAPSSTALYYTALHQPLFTALHCIAPHYSATLHCTTLHCTHPLHCIAPYYGTLHHTLHYTALHRSVAHCTTLHNTATTVPHCTAPHCTTHYTFRGATLIFWNYRPCQKVKITELLPSILYDQAYQLE
jgi:hypothetical protein